MLAAETARVYENLQLLHKSISDNPTYENASHKLLSYESEVSTLLPMLACATCWGESEVHQLAIDLLKQIADDESPNNGYPEWIALRRYPALLIFYGISLAAISRGNFEFLRGLFGLKVKPNRDEPEKLVPAALCADFIWSRQEGRRLIKLRERDLTPLSNHVFDLLSNILAEYFRGAKAFKQAFDWFEYVVALAFATKSSPPSNSHRRATDLTIYVPPWEDS